MTAVQPHKERPPALTDGPAFLTSQSETQSKVYRPGSHPASDRRVWRTDSLESPEDRALRRVCQEVREQPQRLPLAAHRLGGLVNAGRLRYRRTWDALFGAAVDAGASEAWIYRCMYSGFAQSNVSELPSPALWALVNGGVQ